MPDAGQTDCRAFGNYRATSALVSAPGINRRRVKIMTGGGGAR